MSRLMELALQKARELPEQDQEAIASIILQEIESESRWEELFARPESAELLSRMADDALLELPAVVTFEGIGKKDRIQRAQKPLPIYRLD